LPTKLSGVTRTIAIACAVIFPSPACRNTNSHTWFTSSAAADTIRKRTPW
jgi:hypothetical protein